MPTNYSGSNFQIPQLPQQDISDPAAALAIRTLYNALQQIILTISVGNVGGNSIAIIASEAIAYGAPCNIWLNAGTANVRNANSIGKPCHGVCTTSSGVSSGASAIIDFAPAVITIPSLSFTAGSNYWLSTTNGAYSAAADTAAGHIEQFLGVALTATKLFIKPGSWIQH